MTPTDPRPLAYLVLTNGDAQQWSAPIQPRRQLIGRSRQCDIVIPDRFPHVSRRHAEIIVHRCEIKIRDLDSRSGTHVNGIWIEERQEASLMAGDRLWIGGVELDVISELPATSSTAVKRDRELEMTPCNGAQTLPLSARILLAELSPAELAIVLWIGRGYFSDEEIAQKLFRSPNTVRTQINSIFRKLNVRSRADIISLLKGGRCLPPSESSLSLS